MESNMLSVSHTMLLLWTFCGRLHVECSNSTSKNIMRWINHIKNNCRGIMRRFGNKSTNL
ncbi:hypothetical protein GLYMA_14G221866v4 [Glycine max]|nr:hypothetical protein GLYMA_14G221866v4 [Glycine max]KAH1095767.1 hypothetical protein GYH30_040841 [Glycine max]